MNRLKQWREAAGLTVQEVADLTGVQVRRVYAYEADETDPPTGVKVLMARRLGCRIADLFAPAEVPEPVSA
jgi:transcriptional regulator with XRE-family HTH domain